MLDIVKDLVNEGYKIEYYVRNDGGIRVTKIDGRRFTGSEGNKVARAMVGATLSEARTQQLQKIRTPKGKWGHRKLEPLEEDTKKMIRKLQRIYRKRGVQAGKPTQRNYRYILKTYGKAEAQRRLTQSYKYAMGIAYAENVDALLQRISADMAKQPLQALVDLYDKILAKRDIFPEAKIHEVYEPLYEWEQGRMSDENFTQWVNSFHV